MCDFGIYFIGNLLLGESVVKECVVCSPKRNVGHGGGDPIAINSACSWHLPHSRANGAWGRMGKDTVSLGLAVRYLSRVMSYVPVV